MKNKPHSPIIAHRGYWDISGSTQNSIRALELADGLGVYGSEFDAHLCADDIPVINHDDTIQGIPIQATRYDELKHCRLSNGETIPTLEQFLKKGKTLSIKMILEVKPHATLERNRYAAQIIIDMVKQNNLETRTEYITFDLDAGKELIRLVPHGQIVYLGGDIAPAQLKTLGFTGIDYPIDAMKRHPEYFDEAHALDMTVNVWTVDRIAEIQELLGQGADFITSNAPAIYKEEK
jgi:glycerophosphoryl diester phosphodiesterase